MVGRLDIEIVLRCVCVGCSVIDIAEIAVAVIAENSRDGLILVCARVADNGLERKTRVYLCRRKNSVGVVGIEQLAVGSVELRLGGVNRELSCDLVAEDLLRRLIGVEIIAPSRRVE